MADRSRAPAGPSKSPPSWPPALDALVAAPDYHAVLFENAAVRVLDTRIPPRGRTPVHTHGWPSVLYILNWSAFVRRDAEDRIVLDSRTRPELARSPAVVWSPPLAPHSLENVGPTELRVISVELKGIVRDQL